MNGARIAKVAGKGVELLKKIDLAKVEKGVKAFAGVVVAVGGAVAAVGELGDKLSLREKLTQRREARRARGEESRTKSATVPAEVGSAGEPAAAKTGPLPAIDETPRVNGLSGTALADIETGSLPN